jgi:hypothetical protein
MFLALGAYCCLLGLECMAVDSAVLKPEIVKDTSIRREIIPPEWAPWSLVAGGAVVALYSFTIPQRVKSSE